MKRKLDNKEKFGVSITLFLMFYGLCSMVIDVYNLIGNLFN